MLLFINACIRKNSRTRELAEAVLETLKHEPTEEILKVDLSCAELPTLTEDLLFLRDSAHRNQDYSAPVFLPAKDFARADTIVIAAPYWDLSFPAILKKYLETICINGITFRYNEQGIPVGLCKAKKLCYVTTSGGKLFCPEFGYGYVKTLATQMFGIPDCGCFYAENLDIYGNDPEAILEEAKQKVRTGVKML